MTAPRRGGAAGPPPGQVRLIGGRWKRSKLAVPDRPGLRPTPDRVRETLFNWLGQQLDGWRCLDAFAGSGALGFEAASRGAAEVLLIDSDPAVLAALDAARRRLCGEALQPVQLQRADALAWLRRCPPGRFELVLLDPPFGSGLLAPALAAAAGVVVADGYVYAESDAPIEPPPALQRWREGRAGNVHFVLLRRTTLPPSAANPSPP